MPKSHGWIGAMANAFRERPGVGALGVKLLYEDETIQHAGMTSIRPPGFRLQLNAHPGKGLPNRAEAATLRVVEAVTGACLMIGRDTYLKLGGLDESYLLGDFEDSDLCNRLRASGREIYYAPSIELYHLERQSHVLYPDEAWRRTSSMYNAWLHAQRWHSNAKPGAEAART
jgi:GT2 family glycosyltransferase